LTWEWPRYLGSVSIAGSTAQRTRHFISAKTSHSVEKQHPYWFYIYGFIIFKWQMFGYVTLSIKWPQLVPPKISSKYETTYWWRQ
jgi:hypothetical protein